MLRATGARALRPLALLAPPPAAAAARPAASLLLLNHPRRPLSSSPSGLSETHAQHAMLRSDVKSLGRMLGEAISAHSGDVVFQKVCGYVCVGSGALAVDRSMA